MIEIEGISVPCRLSESGMIDVKSRGISWRETLQHRCCNGASDRCMSRRRAS